MAARGLVSGRKTSGVGETMAFSLTPLSFDDDNKGVTAAAAVYSRQLCVRVCVCTRRGFII